MLKQQSSYPDAVWIDLLKAEKFRRYLNNPETKSTGCL